MTNRYSTLTDKPFTHAGVGHSFTRMCGACNKPASQLGGKVQRVLGLRTFVGPCCAKGKA